jgi:uncharacterized membrane protein
MHKQNLLLIALLCSLALNLLVAGVLIGRVGAEPPGEAPPMAWAARELEPEVQQLLRHRMREALPSVRPLREEMRSAGRELRRVLEADEFDPQAVRDALSRMRDVTNRYQLLVQENLIEMAADLPKDQRAALLRAALHRGARPKMP